MTMFSIVTVCFNDAEGLAGTIRSVVQQTCADYQYIIQDGASADGTGDLVRSFADWIDHYDSRPDTGVFQAMNRGLEQCTGRFTLFLNAGDRLLSPDTLRDVAALLEDGDEIVFGSAIAQESGKVHKYRDESEFWLGSVLDHQATFVRTDLAKQLKFDESLRITGDLDFFSRARLGGASFRQISTHVCIKPFAFGLSSDYIRRFEERRSVLTRHFGEQYPVEEALRTELADHIVYTFGLSHRRDELSAMTVPALLAEHRKIAGIAP